MSEDSGEQEVPERGRVQGANRMKAALMTVTGLLGIASCYLVTRRTAEAEFRDERGIEQLSVPGEIYVHVATYMYALPILLWVAGMLLTSAGERAPRLAVGMSGAMLLFALGWEVGSHFAL